MRFSIFALALVVLMLGACQSGPGVRAIDDNCSPCDMMKAGQGDGAPKQFVEGGVRPTQAPDSRKLNLDPNANVSAGSGDSDNVQLKSSEDQTTTGTNAANSIFADAEAKQDARGKGGSTSPVVLSIQQTIRALEARAEELDPNSNAWDKIQTRIAALTDKMMQADGQAAKTYIDFKDLTGATITQYVVSATKSGRGSAIDPEAAAQFAQGIETIQGAMAAVEALKAANVSEPQQKALREALLKKFGKALEDALAEKETDGSTEAPADPTPAPEVSESRPKPSGPTVMILGDTPKDQYAYARKMAIELANAGDMDGANAYKAIADDLASKHPEVLQDPE